MRGGDLISCAFPRCCTEDPYRCDISMFIFCMAFATKPLLPEPEFSPVFNPCGLACTVYRTWCPCRGCFVSITCCCVLHNTSISQALLPNVWICVTILMHGSRQDCWSCCCHRIGLATHPNELRPSHPAPPRFEEPASRC